LTTIFAILPLAIFASGSIQLFAIEMVFGIIVGAYSSNLLAPALFMWISKKKDNAPSPAIKMEAKEISVSPKEKVETPIPTAERKLSGKRKQKK
jgi:predicted RND superfamily exporter protein